MEKRQDSRVTLRFEAQMNEERAVRNRNQRAKKGSRSRDAVIDEPFQQAEFAWLGNIRQAGEKAQVKAGK